MHRAALRKKLQEQISPKDYPTKKKAISILTHLPINVTIRNKTIAGDKISLESHVPISGLTSRFEKSYLLQKIIAVSAGVFQSTRRDNFAARTIPRVSQPIKQISGKQRQIISRRDKTI